MAALWSICLYAIALGSIRVKAEENSPQNVFISPTAPWPSDDKNADLSWAINTTHTVQWTTVVDAPYCIELYQQGNSSGNGSRIQTIYDDDEGNAGQHSFDWNVSTYTANTSLSPVYYLSLDSGDSRGFNSHYFNITSQTQSSPTSSSSTASVSATMPVSTPSSPLSQTAQGGSQSQGGYYYGSSGPNRSALGLGLGIGIPIIIIAVVGLCIGIRIAKRRKLSSRNMGSTTPLFQYSEKQWSPSLDPSLEKGDHNKQATYEFPHKPVVIHEAPPGNRALPELDSGGS